LGGSVLAILAETNLVDELFEINVNLSFKERKRAIQVRHYSIAVTNKITIF
jgi:hypothetical protein